MSRYQWYCGIPLPNFYFYLKENIEGILAYHPRDGDIIIASYPKTGTTWLQYIVLQITSKGDIYPTGNDVVEKMAPLMEMMGPEVIDSLTGVRIYKHHFRYDMVNKNPKAKTLCIYRKPEDIVISFYLFMSQIWEEKLTVSEFFEGFLTGDVEYGSYFKHLLSYLAHKDDDNLLMISYEKLKTNPREGILRIAKFLGEEYYRSLSEDASILEKIVERTSFGFMKKNLDIKLPFENRNLSEKAGSTIDFFRKGVIGEGKTMLSPEQMKRLQEAAEEAMKGCEILKEWF